MTVEDNLRVINWCHEEGIKVKGFFIANLPYSTLSTARESLSFERKHCVLWDMYPLVLFPGTALWERPERYGLEVLDRSFGFYEATKGRVEKLNIHDPVCFPAEQVLKFLNEVKE